MRLLMVTIECFKNVHTPNCIIREQRLYVAELLHLQYKHKNWIFRYIGTAGHVNVNVN